MSKVKITMELTDGYQSPVSITREVTLRKPDQPEYGEPGYDSNRKYPSVDWHHAEQEASDMLDFMRDDFIARLVDHGERDVAKVARVNAAKGIKPVEVQRAEDEASQAVDAIVG